MSPPIDGHPPPMITLWCNLKGDSSLFTVEIAPEQTVAFLKELVHSKAVNTFKGIDAKDLILWKPTVQINVIPKTSCFERVRALDLSKHAVELDEGYQVAAIFPQFVSQDALAALKNVELDPLTIPPEHDLTTLESHKVLRRSHLHVIVQKPDTAPTALIAELEPHVHAIKNWQGSTFKFYKLRSFGGLEGLTLNGISQSSHLPIYIKKFLSQLQSKRKIRIGNVQADALKEKLQQNFDKHFEEIPLDSEISTSDNLEFEQYVYLYGSEQNVDSQSLAVFSKESFVAHWINRPALYLKKALVESQISYRKSWAFPIVGELEREGPTEYYKYTPQSDFHLSIQDIPYILLEVVSDEIQESDRYRMLIQASYVARLANRFRKPDAPPFVVTAIYFDKRNFDRYLVYQPDRSSPSTFYLKDTFSIHDSYCGFQFLFQLYNYASAALWLKERLDNPAPYIAELKIDSDIKRLRSFHQSKVSKKRQRERDDSGDMTPSPGPSQSGNRVQGSVFDDPAVRTELISMGYDVAEAWVEMGIQPFDRISPTVSVATYTDKMSCHRVVLKFIKELSSELRILEHLTAIKSPQNHTVALHQKIKIHCGFIVAFPYLRPLPSCIPPNEEHVVALTRQFIEAVSFMHHNSIAHLDLKPDNILVNVDHPPHCLWITDFSLSVWVTNEHEMLKGYAGTAGWTAPEIGDQSGPPQKYSPILADRWSCGKLIQYFKTFGPGFTSPAIERFGQLLLSEDPAKRPSLTDQPWWSEEGARRVVNPDRHNKKGMEPTGQKRCVKKRRATGQGVGEPGKVRNGRSQQSKVGKVKEVVYDREGVKGWA